MILDMGDYSGVNDQTGEYINYAEFLKHSLVNGPGNRAVLWVQGCPIHCEGCFNKSMWAFTPNRITTVKKMAQRIKGIKNIQGVTFTGGEPFQQAKSLIKLISSLKETELDIVTFTGYTVDDITHTPDPSWNELLYESDLVISGPYQSWNPSKQLLLSSKNQCLIFNKPQLMEHPYFQKVNYREEYIIHKNGEIILTGIP